MAQYVIVYLGGNQPATAEEGRQHFAKYMQWLKAMGEAVVSPMNPMTGTHTISAEGVVTGGSVAMTGYTIIEAASMDDALSMSKTCPFLDIGGTLEVSELVKMPG